MRTSALTTDDFRGVFPVPPLCRNNDARRTINFAETEKIARHIAAGGIRNFLYGGNAFLYHLTLAEFEALLDWSNGPDDSFLMIPERRPVVRTGARSSPSCAATPSDRDAAPVPTHATCRPLERGIAISPKPASCISRTRTISARAKPVSMPARLVRAKRSPSNYAVVRKNPSEDAYLDGLLKRVDHKRHQRHRRTAGDRGTCRLQAAGIRPARLRGAGDVALAVEANVRATGPKPHRCASTSSRSRICVTRGVRRECCTRPWNSPGSPSRDQSHHT